jgi:sister-chromatid-cohesion protein PDS5
MNQENDEKYRDLAVHLAQKEFFEHANKDVRLLVACCVADLFRINAPEAPFQGPELLHDIFLFLTSQLAGLETTNSPLFNRYFYLLENLAWVKSFNICLGEEISFCCH